MSDRDIASLVETVRRALDALKFDFADGDDPMELEPVRWPTERTTEQALAALDALAARAEQAERERDARIRELDAMESDYEDLRSALRGPVHNHGPHEGPGLDCYEYKVGACIADALTTEGEPQP